MFLLEKNVKIGGVIIAKRKLSEETGECHALNRYNQ